MSSVARLGTATRNWLFLTLFRVFHRGGVLEYTADAKLCVRIVRRRPIYDITFKHSTYACNPTRHSASDEHHPRTDYLYLVVGDQSLISLG